MIDSKKLERINKALGYWSMIDFLTQDSLPETSEFARVYCAKNYSDEGKSFISVYHKFEHDFDKDTGNTIRAFAESDITNAIRNQINCLEKKRSRTDKENADLNCLRSAVACNALPQPTAIDIYIGITPKEPVIAALQEKLAESMHGLKKRQEIETDDLASALVHLNGSGAITGLDISPAIWLLTHNSINADECNSTFEKDTKGYSDDIVKRYGKRPATFCDLRAIITELFPAALQERVDTFLKDHPTYRPKSDCLPLYRSIISYQATDNPDQEPAPGSLHSSFYSKDIEAVRSAIDHASERGNGAPDPLAHSQLKLVLSYLEGGLEHHEKRDARRIDIQSASDELKKRRASIFYQNILGLDHTPLGRWPSKYGLSLMQQTAVNLVAGRNLEQIAITTGIPFSDVMSVNGPPGTGKTTLLKDIIAANIVEKARLLSSYAHPDRAFSEIENVDGYIKAGPQSTSAIHAYRLDNPKIAELGIIVCSSNNTAVENISKELPQGAALLDGLEDEAKDPHREQAMFRGEKEDELNLFETIWKFKESGGGFKRKKPETIPDLYFSPIACEQFDKPKQDCTPLDMLISARLGKNDNIKSFRDNTLDELIYAQSQDTRRIHFDRFKRSKKAFLEQYSRVEELMTRYGNEQNDVLRRQAAVEEARLRLTRAKSELEQATCISENAKHELSEIFSNSIQRLKSNGEHASRLNQVNDIHDLQNLEDQIRRELASYTGELRSHESRLESLRQSHESASHFLGALKRRKLEREILEAEKDLTIFREKNLANERLSRFRCEIEEELAKLKISAQVAQEAERTLTEAKANLEQTKTDQKTRQGELARSLSSCPHALTPDLVESLTGENPDQHKLHDAHLFTPSAAVLDENELRYERDKLFLRALQVTRDFILSSWKMANNFRLLNAYWGARAEKANGTGKGKITFSSKDAPIIVPALFQTLSILTPVISTTFAAAGRLFRDVPIVDETHTPPAHAPLGLCVIDEAGQAVPQAAVGILARCNKALVVGDPYQIEPVVDSEVKMFTELLGKPIDLPFKSCTSSVQALADATNPIGHYRRNSEDEDEWIGCPLVVHRRCISPMFEISNEISYTNSMINETTKLDPEKNKEKLKGFYLPSSQWINVTGHENGNKDHYVPAQGERTKEIVLSAFEKKPKDVAIPSLYIISPFSTVAKGVRKALEECRPHGVNEKTWDSFLDNNIGTVHKFQGKEAQEVIFMLGCDSSASGAVRWVNPNIVNVAASRARQRLYVIADYNVWKHNESIRTMKRIMDTTWIDLWNESQAYGGKGIEDARRALPHLESLPTSNFISPATSSRISNSAASNPDVVARSDYENERFDTDVFLKNARPLLMHHTLSKSVCMLFGFEDEDALNSAFSTCADPNDPSSNRVLSNIKMGMFLYDLFDIDRRSSEEDQEDWSFCAIMFCRAAELFLQLKLLPSLKEINPKLAVGGKQTIAERKELSLGQYHHALCDKGSQTTCGMAAGYRCGNDTSEAGAIISNTTPQDPEWWGSFGENLEKLAGTRNDFCHAGRSTNPNIKKLLARLFNNHIKREEQGSHVALLCEGRTLEIAKEGINSQSFARTMQELVETNLETPVQTANSITPRQEQPEKAAFIDNQKAISESENQTEQTPACLTQSTNMASPSESSSDRTPASDQLHRFEGEYHSISQWKTNYLKDELDSYPGLSDGATKINQVLEREDYISYKPTRFTQKALDSWDVQEREGHNKDGTTFIYPVYSYSALIKALKVYNSNKDKTES